MSAPTRIWRKVSHPLQIVTRKGWRFGKWCLVSPRGTVFCVRVARHGFFARRQHEFQLNDP